MGWIVFLGMGEWKGFSKDSQMSHSHPFEKAEDSTSEQTTHAMDLSKGNFFFSHKMEG
jgi:hypothetical protein